MEIPDKIPGRIATKISISGIELEEDSPWYEDSKKEIIKIPDWLFKFITTKISISYTEGGNDKVKEFKKLLKIDG